MSDLDTKIDKLLTIVAETILDAGVQHEVLWPIYTPHGLLYWREAWAGKLLSVLKELDKKGLSDKDVAKLFMTSSRVAQTLWRVDAIKRSNLHKKEKLYVIQKLLDYLATYRRENIFCGDGRNIIWGGEETKSVTKSLQFSDVAKDKDAKQFICALESSLWLYTELIYWTNHPFGHSFHGPYAVKEGDLIARNYFDLKPEIWPFTSELNFNQVEVFEVYKGANIKFDFFERGIRTTQSFRDKMLKFAVRIDGKPIVGKDALQSALESLNHVAAEGSQHIQSLDMRDMIFKHAEMWFYVIKLLCEAAGMDWKPPREVYDNVFKRFDELEKVWEGIQAGMRKGAKLPRSEMMENLRRDFDPRL